MSLAEKLALDKFGACSALVAHFQLQVTNLSLLALDSSETSSVLIANFSLLASCRWQTVTCQLQISSQLVLLLQLKQVSTGYWIQANLPLSVGLQFKRGNLGLKFQCWAASPPTIILAVDCQFLLLSIVQQLQLCTAIALVCGPPALVFGLIAVAVDRQLQLWIIASSSCGSSLALAVDRQLQLWSVSSSWPPHVWLVAR